MRKNNFILSIVVLLLGFTVSAQAPAPAPSSTAPNAAAATKTKKKVKIDYENEVVTGSYDVPDAQFLNSRKLIKYKELFNKRTNFIEEIEANKGLFNEYQK